MRNRVLLHAAVVLITIGSLKIAVERGIGHDIATNVNLPLAIATLISVGLLELFRRRLTPSALALLSLSSFVYFASALFLPLRTHEQEPASILAYASITIILTIAIVTALSRRPSFVRISVAVVVVLLISTGIGIAYTYLPDSEFDGGRMEDAAVVLGGAVWGPHTPSPDLKARLDAAAHLFRKGQARKIVVTGGTRRFDTYESEIGARYLRERGIPASRIMTERRTLNTFEQVCYVKDVLMDSLKMKKVVIVSDAWHLPRAMFMCRLEHIKAHSYPSNYKMSPQAELYWRARESAGLQVYLLFGA